ncbi:ribosome recycling factor [Aestuariispira insulae]|uniref:Ribosome-recycling factor n=1 Tax=Aestuariispira insulae TaxID=1461337 RepID=A0A3D9HV31_9PROT|nr:ribosome recycling factor [Aestuariispira insulae]RED53299.1 ribosome recycling factor [Aestuariispira insulae]
MAVLDMKDLDKRMNGALDVLAKEFAGLRTGRASPNLLDPIMVDAYGSMVPINQVAGVSVPEPRMLTVTVWDATVTKAVEKAIRESDLGLNPMTEGNVLRVPLPELNEERRQDLQKVAGKYAEAARVAIRNVRRDGMDHVKKAEKDSEISKDDAHRMSDEIQKATDDHIKKVDEALATKEQEIMQV